MSGDDGFLARWSRRKREARVGLPEGEVAQPAGPEGDAGKIGEPRDLDAAPELSAEEVAALPPLDELTAQTDLAPFLRVGVPDLLRKAALRRMWALDPAVRDFVGEARDYSWDWNVAGGVPGHGPILPSDEIEATVARLFERRPDPPTTADDGVAEPSSESPSASFAGTVEEPGGAQDGVEAAREEAATLPASGQTDESSPGAGRNRRHGGAVPL